MLASNGPAVATPMNRGSMRTRTAGTAKDGQDGQDGEEILASNGPAVATPMNRRGRQSDPPGSAPSRRGIPSRDVLAGVACLAAGAALPLSFAPFGLFPVAFVSLAVLFLAWHGCGTPRRAFLRGWLFGVGAFGVGVSWIYKSFAFARVEGGLAFVLTTGLVACLALYPAVLGWIVVRVAPPKVAVRPATDTPAVLGWIMVRVAPAGDAPRLLAVYPAAWTLWEWLRGWAFTGFPWLQVGYAQVDGPASGWLPVLGVHGAGALTACVAGGLAFVLARREGRAVVPLAAAAALWGAGAGLAGIEWVRPAGPPVKVAIVQGNVGQDRKWRPEMRGPTLDRYTRLTREHFDADLVVWPESAIPAFHDTQAEFTRGLLAEAVLNGSAVAAGILVREGPGGPYLNAVAMFGPEPGLYFKRRLVPFGEYMPFAFVLRPVAAALGVRMVDFSPGPREQEPMRLGSHAIGVSICYEIAFGSAVRLDLPEAALLVTVSNDAWFGDSIGPHQHLEIARVRAAETGRWLVRATNTGLSAVVSPRGEVRGRLPQFEVAADTFEVVPMHGETPCVRFGDAPVLLAAAVWLAAGLVRARRTSPAVRPGEAD